MRESSHIVRLYWHSSWINMHWMVDRFHMLQGQMVVGCLRCVLLWMDMMMRKRLGLSMCVLDWHINSQLIFLHLALILLTNWLDADDFWSIGAVQLPHSWQTLVGDLSD